ncbi:MAG TPA: hypothetical protein VGM50_17090, partial [Gemmatimonadaceae bacterium]
MHRKIEFPRSLRNILESFLMRRRSSLAVVALAVATTTLPAQSNRGVTQSGAPASAPSHDPTKRAMT